MTKKDRKDKNRKAIQKKTRKEQMKAYEILTGELVMVYANSEEEAMEKLSDGDYEELETLSEVQNVRNAPAWIEEANV